jgi:putative ABC transport system permease protein
MINHAIKTILISLKKNRFFYFINLFGFITGFLVLSVILSYVFQELSFDGFHENSNSIYRIHSGGYGVTPPCFADKLRNQLPEIRAVVRFIRNDLTCINNENEILIDDTYYTDPEIFNVFSFKLLSGNPEKALIEPNSIIINQSTANKLFGRDFPIGETIQVKDGEIFTVTGIMEDFPYNSHLQARAFISIETLKNIDDGDELGCSTWSMLTYVELTEQAIISETTQKINSIIGDFRMGEGDGTIPLELQQLKDVYFDYENNKYDGCKHGNRQTVLLYFAISVLILLIVVINHVNLSTLMAGARAREIALRKITGATRFQIIIQSIFEAMPQMIIACLIAILAMELFLTEISSLLNISISKTSFSPGMYIWYFCGFAIIGFISGLIPGITLSKINVLKALKGESLINSRGWQRKALLIIQLVIVAIFLNSAFIFNRQMSFISGKDLGFNYGTIIYLNLDEILSGKKELLKTALVKNPNVVFVSYSDGMLGGGFCKSILEYNDDAMLCNIFSIDPDYLHLYQIEMMEGRNFTWDLASDFSNSCIINEETCRAFNLINPIGKEFNGRTIIGVVSDFHFSSLHQQIQPLVINALNIKQCDNGSHVQIKGHPGNVNETKEFIEQACKNISPGFDGNFTFLEKRIEELYTSELDIKNSFQAYSIITFMIALLGLFGLFQFTVKKKAREVSMRKLFGAKLNNTFLLLAKGQMWFVFISNIVAIPITYFVMDNWLNNFQYRIEIGLLVFVQTFLITLAFTLLTILFLILKVHRANLIEALKHE